MILLGHFYFCNAIKRGFIYLSKFICRLYELNCFLLNIKAFVIRKVVLTSNFVFCLRRMIDQFSIPQVRQGDLDLSQNKMMHQLSNQKFTIYQ